MPAADRRIWAIDIGSSALKALCMHETDEGLAVNAFDYVEHSDILSAEDFTDMEIHDAIAETLSTFVSRNEIDKKDQIAISVAGNKSFARFVPLPPVEAKDVPRVVQFEAVQQIPFDINEVEWGWQLMEDPDNPENIVGLFAIKNEILSNILDFFAAENLKVVLVQIAPMAIHNYALYDRNDVGPASGKATVILDMGAEDTTLIVSTATSVWQRTIRIGGNSFTEAISDAFKVRFKKAEKLKRTAPVSKYVRQIFSAMKPVFTDYSSEIQRSLGFYTSNVGGKGYSRIIALGGAMKLKGLAKYLQQSLGIPVIKPDTFETLQLDESASPAKFHEHVSDFGICYGLGVQAFGEAKIETNLLPRHIARAMAFARKARMLTMAACILVAVSMLCLGKVFLDKGKYAAAQSEFDATKQIITQAKGIDGKVKEYKQKSAPLDKMIKDEMAYYQYRDIIPRLTQSILKCLPNAENTPSDSSLHEAFLQGDVDTVKSIPRPDRRQLFVTGMKIEFSEDIEKATFAKLGDTRRNSGRERNMRNQMSPDMMMMMMDPMLSGDMGMGMMGGQQKPVQEAEEDDGTLKTGPGFVVVIEGYSPYKNIDELMDPLDVSKDKTMWGLVTRLENLIDIETKEQFLLFGKGNIKNFNQETGPVDASSTDTPVGIGVLRQIDRVPMELLSTSKNKGYGNKMMGGYNYGTARVNRITVEDVLIDPMTNEEMSKTYDLITENDLLADPGLTKKDIGVVKLDDAQGTQMFIERDHWFRISAKFRWMGAPEKKEPEGMAGYGEGF